MVLILLEALGALLALVLIVWWTMFSGRKNGELPDETALREPPPEDAAARDRPQASGKPPASR